MSEPTSGAGKSAKRRRFGGYEILETLGRQGGAYIYQARQITLDRKVRLVVLPAHEARKEAYRVRFEREVAVVTNVHHMNVLGPIEAGEINGHRYVVTEDVAGRTLADALAAGRTFAADEALRIAKEIATALDRFEAQGFVHRYVTPRAVVLSDAGIAKLAGFSRAKRRQGRGSETWFEMETDECYYTPPERMKAGGKLDARGDLYALGCVLYQMLAGRPPFQGSSAIVLEAHAKHAPPALQGVPRPAATVTLNCLRKSRAERYQHASELIADIDRALAGEDVAELGAPRPTKPKRRRGLFRKRA